MPSALDHDLSEYLYEPLTDRALAQPCERDPAYALTYTGRCRVHRAGFPSKDALYCTATPAIVASEPAPCAVTATFRCRAHPYEMCGATMHSIKAHMEQYRVPAPTTTDVGQSWRASVVEVVAGTVIGMGVALAMQYAVLPHYGLPAIGFDRHLEITILFTAASLVRGYFVRRLFNWLR